MKVSSPVGEFPFDPDRVTIVGTRVVLEGTWAHGRRVEMEPADGLRLAQLVLPRVAGPALGVLLIASILRRIGRRGNG